MKVTVAEAKNLAEKLTRGKDIDDLGVPEQPKVSLSKGVEHVVSVTKDQFLTSINDHLDRIEKIQEASLTLRNLISKKNSENGVNDIIAEIAMIDRLSSSVTSLNSTFNDFFDESNSVDELTDMYDHNMRKDEADRKLFPTVRVSVSEEISQVTKEKLRKLKFRRDTLLKKRDHLNHSNHLDIPKDVEVIMRDNGLIE